MIHRYWSVAKGEFAVAINPPAAQEIIH